MSSIRLASCFSSLPLASLSLLRSLAVGMFATSSGSGGIGANSSSRFVSITTSLTLSLSPSLPCDEWCDLWAANGWWNGSAVVYGG